MKYFFLILILGFNLTACKKAGTDTGNPITDTGNPVSRGNPLTDPFSQRVVMSLCTSLFACYPNIDAVTCQTTLLTVPNLAVDFGFSTHSTLTDITSDPSAKYNDENFNTCLDTIDNLPCSSYTMTNAYSANNPDNFNNIHILMETSTLCNQTNDPTGISANP